MVTAFQWKNGYSYAGGNFHHHYTRYISVIRLEMKIFQIEINQREQERLKKIIYGPQ